MTVLSDESEVVAQSKIVLPPLESLCHSILKCSPCSIPSKAYPSSSGSLAHTLRKRKT